MNLLLSIVLYFALMWGPVILKNVHCKTYPLPLRCQGFSHILFFIFHQFIFKTKQKTSCIWNSLCWFVLDARRMGWFLSCHVHTWCVLLKVKKLEKLKLEIICITVKQFWSDLMCGYWQWWCTGCINISLTRPVASRKRQLASACLCNLLFCWRLQETVVVHVPVWNMIQQGGKNNETTCKSSMDIMLEREAVLIIEIV